MYYYCKVPLCKMKTYQASYFNRIVKLWNIISKEVSLRSFPSPTSFKRFLFAKLLDTVFDVDFTCTCSLAPDCSCRKYYYIVLLICIVLQLRCSLISCIQLIIFYLLIYKGKHLAWVFVSRLCLALLGHLIVV